MPILLLERRKRMLKRKVERITVRRKDGSVRICEIMLDENTNKYCFVNLTSHHVCKCRFDTIDDAYEDLKNDSFVENFYVESYIE